MDTTGYGRSTRPAPMNDPCNLAARSQARSCRLIAAPCTPTYPHSSTTIASDWNDIGAVGRSHPRAAPRREGEPGRVVARRSARRRLRRRSTRRKSDGWCCWRRPTTATARRTARADPAGGVPSTRSRAQEFNANWDRQVGCPDQYDQAAARRRVVGDAASDPVGATWGTGVRRAPQTTTWGWNAAMVGKTEMPTLMVAGVHDKQVPPERVQRALCRSRRARQGASSISRCSSHNAMWERNHLLLFRASLEWLTTGTVNGAKEGMLRLGYTGE